MTQSSRRLVRGIFGSNLRILWFGWPIIKALVHQRPVWDNNMMNLSRIGFGTGTWAEDPVQANVAVRNRTFLGFAL